MDEAERKAIREEWLRNEAELLKLRDLPVGQSDPAAREDELEKRQDEIEYELGTKEGMPQMNDAAGQAGHAPRSVKRGDRHGWTPIVPVAIAVILMYLVAQFGVAALFTTEKHDPATVDEIWPKYEANCNRWSIPRMSYTSFEDLDDAARWREATRWPSEDEIAAMPPSVARQVHIDTFFDGLFSEWFLGRTVGIYLLTSCSCFVANLWRHLRTTQIDARPLPLALFRPARAGERLMIVTLDATGSPVSSHIGARETLWPPHRGGADVWHNWARVGRIVAQSFADGFNLLWGLVKWLWSVAVAWTK